MKTQGHNIGKKLKQALIYFLAQPIVGRPLRKFFWTWLRFSQYVTNKLDRIFWRLPYVVKLNRKQEALNDGEKLTNYYRHLRAISGRMPYQPKISVIIPLYKVEPKYFQETLQSVAAQAYQNWEVCVVDDCSRDPRLVDIINDFSERHPGQVHFRQNETNLHISETSNRCLELATGDYVALLDHDDLLMPNALAEMVRHINLFDQPDILYSDERTIDQYGDKRNTAYFKPGWSPFMHLSMNYTTHLTLYKLDLTRKVGGFRKGFEGSQDHDLMLRMVEASTKPVTHVPFSLYQWRAHPASTASSLNAKPYAAIAGEKAVREACLRRGRPAQVEFEPETMHYRVKFDLPNPLPLISIIIPSKDHPADIERCLTSIFENTSYPNYEVILVDNGSTNSRCKLTYERYLKSEPKRFQVIDAPGPFNFAALNHAGIKASRGDYFLFLNNDTEVITAKWIEELLRLAQFPEVGAVGCKLLYSDNGIQHAGIILSGKDVAYHAGLRASRDHNLYCNILNTVHEVSAVTAACMLISRKNFELAGGFDEIYLPNGYGDVDLCLKLGEKGLTNIYTPYAILMHHESQSRRQAIEHFERNTMIQRWGDKLLRDPYLNPNLSYHVYYYTNPANLDLDPRWTEPTYD